MPVSHLFNSISPKLDKLALTLRQDHSSMTNNLFPRHLLDPDSIAPQKISYQAGGQTLTGYLFNHSGQPQPGILVAHEAPGLNEHVKARAQALAELGYTTFALDMYGEEGFPYEQAMSRHEALGTTPGLVTLRAIAAYETFLKVANVDPARIAIVGFCQGGITALELARTDVDLRAVIGFHPGLTLAAGGLNKAIKAQVLLMIGDSDPVITKQARDEFTQEMNARGVNWQLHLFGGVGHTFTNPAVDALNRDGFAYNEFADRHSWRMAINLLTEALM